MIASKQIRVQTANSDVAITVPNKEEIDESGSELRKALWPMTFSMRVFGLYFVKEDRKTKKEQCLRIYSIVLCTLFWLNFARSFTVVTPNDTVRTGLFGKCMVIGITAITAMVGSSCYRTNASGQLETVFQIFSKEMNSHQLKTIRIRAIVGAAAAWFLIIFVIGSNVVILFSDYSRASNPWIAPFSTIILDSSVTVINLASTLVFISFPHLTAATFMPLFWNFLIASLFQNEFCNLISKFRLSVEDHRSSKDDIYETTRQKHQSLCKLVRRVDRYMCLTNAVYLVGFVSVVILELYGFLSVPEMSSMPVFFTATLTWTLWSVLGLCILAYGGIIVNHSVRCFFLFFVYILFWGIN